LVTIPETHRDIIDSPNFAHLATLMKDGSPQVTPVWVDYDGTYLLINSAEGRVKTRNLDRDGRVALSIHDQSNPYRYVQIRGHVVSRTNEGADAHIDRLAKKYLGQDSYPGRSPTEKRVVFRVLPESVQVMG